MTLDADEIRDRLEDRWKRIGYDALLPEERDFILTWWLEVEASNGSLHQYFANSTGDSATDASDALERIGAPRAASVLRDAMKLFGDGPYPADRADRNKILNAITDVDDVSSDRFARLTDRLFEESEDVRTLALNRVGDAYANGQIADETASGMKSLQWIALLVLCTIALLATGMILAMVYSRQP